MGWGSAWWGWPDSSGGSITGSGTTNQVAKFTGASAIGNSRIQDTGAGSIVFSAGINVTGQVQGTSGAFTGNVGVTGGTFTNTFPNAATAVGFQLAGTLTKWLWLDPPAGGNRIDLGNVTDNPAIYIQSTTWIRLGNGGTVAINSTANAVNIGSNWKTNSSTGHMGLGGASASAAYGLQTNYTAMTGTIQNFAFFAGTITSTATTGALGVNILINTQNASFTTPVLYNLRLEKGVKGAAHTVTTHHGLYIEDIDYGGTNYAIYTNAGTVRFGDTVNVNTLSGSRLVKTDGSKNLASADLNNWIGSGSGISVVTDGAGGVTISATGGGIGGSGSVNYVAKFTAGTTLGNSSIQDNGSLITLGNNTSLAGHLEFTANGTIAAGRIVKSSTDGLTMRAIAGVTFDFLLQDASGNDIMSILTGTSTTVVYTSNFRFNALQASRLMSTDASKGVTSVSNLTSWIGSGSGINVADDGDGTVTISATGGSPNVDAQTVYASSSQTRSAASWADLNSMTLNTSNSTAKKYLCFLLVM